MPSQLWERLRAARRYADMTQAQLAAACGVTRSAYAFMESKDPNARSRPSAEQVMAIARLTKVPVEWLMNDAVDPGEVWKIGVISGSGPRPAQAAQQHAAGPHPHRRSTDGPDRMAQLFWSAVQYHVLISDPSRASAFDVVVREAPLPLTVRYLHGTAAVCFTHRSDPDSVALYMGRLLLHERALARALDKHLLVWHRDGDVELDGTVAAALQAFGVRIRQVATAEEAASYLLSHS